MRNVMVTGSFDELNETKLSILEEASSYGKVVVGLLTENYNERRGVPSKNSNEDRLMNLFTCEYVDQVVYINCEKDILRNIEVNNISMFLDVPGTPAFTDGLLLEIKDRVIYLDIRKDIRLIQNGYETTNVNKDDLDIFGFLRNILGNNDLYFSEKNKSKAKVKKIGR